MRNWLVALGIVVALGTRANAAVIIYGQGDRVDDVSPIDADHRVNIEAFATRLGWHYHYFSLMFLDMWRWDGELVLYHSDRYLVLDDELAARAGVDRSSVDAPWTYRVPPGLLVAAGLIAVSIIADVRRRRRRPALVGLAADARYRHALSNIDPLDPAKWTFEQGVAYLVAQGIDPVEARRNLKLVWNG